MKTVDTALLRIAYEEWNPGAARSVVLLHGWPDSPRCWSTIAPALAQHGWRVLAPALRGFAPTRFLRADTPRTGQLSSLGRDLLEFVDALGLHQPAFVGHDWGARAGANACGLRPGVASHLVMLSVGYGTNNPGQPLSLFQARNYWYHWYMATPRGERTVREDRHSLVRILWDTWAPAGWYDEDEFAVTAQAFENDDWPDVTLHSYRHRWGHAAGDPYYAADEAALHPAPELDVPTLILHGADDGANHPDTSAGKEHLFRGRYERKILEGVGHFPPREAAALVAAELLRFLAHQPLSAARLRGWARPLRQLLGGTQDNGTFLFNGSRVTWPQVIFGDGGQSGFNAADTSISFHTYFSSQVDSNFRNNDPLYWVWISDPFFVAPQQSASFYIPIIPDPNPAKGGSIFAGLQSVQRTTDNGGDKTYLKANCGELLPAADPNAFCGDWEKIGPKLATTLRGNYLAALARTPGDTGTLWAASRFGAVFVSHNADAASAASVTFKRIDTLAPNAPNRFVSGIYVDPADSGHAFISYSGYSAATPTKPGHVFPCRAEATTRSTTTEPQRQVELLRRGGRCRVAPPWVGDALCSPTTCRLRNHDCLDASFDGHRLSSGRGDRGGGCLVRIESEIARTLFRDRGI